MDRRGRTDGWIGVRLVARRLLLPDDEDLSGSSRKMDADLTGDQSRGSVRRRHGWWRPRSVTNRHHDRRTSLQTSRPSWGFPFPPTWCRISFVSSTEDAAAATTLPKSGQCRPPGSWASLSLSLSLNPVLTNPRSNRAGQKRSHPTRSLQMLECNWWNFGEDSSSSYEVVLRRRSSTHALPQLL